MSKLIDLTGKRFGRLIVIKLLKERSKCGRAVWKCECDCGNFCNIPSQSLSLGYTTSCGCYKLECNRRGKNGRILLPGEASFHALYLQYRSCAKRRSLPLTLSEKECIMLFTSNCYYCGSNPSGVYKSKIPNGSILYNGIDRVDNSRGYDVDNCVPCCWRCNSAKKAQSRTEFLDWIRKVYLYNFEIKHE